jgi:hypothetical protein
MDDKVLIAFAAACLALLVAAQAALFVYADGQAWWPWNGFRMVLTGVLVLAVVSVADQGSDRVAVRSRARHDDGGGTERR